MEPLRETREVKGRKGEKEEERKRRRKERRKEKRREKRNKERLEELIVIQKGEELLGGLRRKKRRWKKLGVSKEVWRWLEEGAPLLFEKGKRPQPRRVRVVRGDKKANEVLEKYVREQEEEGWVRRVETRPEVISPIFAIPKKRKREVESNSGFETCEQNTKGSEISERELRGSGDNVESRRLYGEGGYQERFPSHGDERRTQKISGFSSGERVLPIRGDGDGKHSVTIHISQTGETSNRICQGQDGDSSSVVCPRFVGNGKVEDRGGGKHGGGIVITEEFGMAHKLGEVGVGSKTNEGVLRDDDRYIGGGTNDKSTISEEEIDKKGGTKVVRGGREGTSISENGCKSSGKMPSNIEGGSNNTNFHKESDEMLT